MRSFSKSDEFIETANQFVSSENFLAGNEGVKKIVDPQKL